MELFDFALEGAATAVVPRTKHPSPHVIRCGLPVVRGGERSVLRGPFVVRGERRDRLSSEQPDVCAHYQRNAPKRFPATSSVGAPT
jgi:hypothetical protein